MASNMRTCPEICPKPGEVTKPAEHVEYLQAGQSRGPENPYASPYVPGQIQPPERKVFPPNAPPRYFSQPTESTSGDILGMGPIGPWAAGHLDWSPQAGTTGTRPVVDKYSITRYSTGEWRRNNQEILNPRPIDKSNNLEADIKRELGAANARLDEAGLNTNKNLDKRIKDLTYWKKEVQKTVDAITEEIATLDRDRAKLKGACKILMLPEAISRECIELRTNRYEPDLVRDEAEQELIKEVAIVGEIRRVFNDTLAKVEEQMAENRAAKSTIEFDWSDKMVSLKLDKENLSMPPESNIIRYHAGVARWPENATSLEYWQHFCSESIRNCEEVRKKSERLRGSLMTAIVNGGQDLRNQADRTNVALADSVATTEALCNALEDALKATLQRIADIENLLDYLNEELRKLDERAKLNQTRLFSRNYERPRVENCRDEAQYALMAEAKLLKETAEAFKHKVRETDLVRSELMKYRGDLEKQIASKRKSLNIDKDRFTRVRSHFPSAEEFAT